MAVGFGGQSQQRWGDNTLNAQEYMRDVLLLDTKGRQCSSALARRGGSILLAFFKTTCPTCQMMFPYLQKLHEAYGASGKFTLWGVSQDDGEKTEAFAERYGITFPLLLDRELYHSMLYGLTHVPTVFLADGTGLVQKKLTGWSRNGVNDISRIVAQAAGVPLVTIVEDDDPAPALKPG